jgi:hypothetical protein
MAIFQQTLEKLQHFPLHPVASEAATFTGATTNIADLGEFDGDIQVILDAGAAAAKQVLTLNRDALKRYIRFVGTIASSGTTIYSVNGYGLKKYG